MAGDLLAIDMITDGPARDGPVKDAPALDRTPATDGPGKDLTGDATAFPLCSTRGGYCTKHRWVICGVGYEPIHPSPHQDCGSGWCCVKAPASTCSAKAGVNCVWGTKCTGCWGAARDTSLTCEAGRVCCMDICD